MTAAPLTGPEPAHPLLVVGAGIGGLVLGRALVRAGLSCELVERAEELRPSGAGITLGANAIRVLEGLGLGAAVTSEGHPIETAAVTDEAGRVLSSGDLAELEEKFGRAYAIHRGALHRVLARGLEEPGPNGAAARLELGTTVLDLRETDEGVLVAKSSGATGLYRAVVGADGLHSTVRRLVFGEIAPRYSGYTCFRWTGRVPGGVTRTVEMWGRGARVGLVPLGAEEVYAFLVVNAPPGTPRDAAPSARELHATFSSFGGDVPRLLDAIDADEGALLHHDIEEIELDRWSQGAVTLLGDAAHAMTPNMGQGAAMAIEDALVLGRELAAHHAPTRAFSAYEARRRPRVLSIQRASRRIGRVGQWQSPAATWLRNWILRMAPKSSVERTIEGVVAYVP